MVLDILPKQETERNDPATGQFTGVAV